MSPSVVLTLLTFASILQAPPPPKLPPPRLWRPPEVKLVEAGKEPRQLLRYALIKDRHGAATLDGSGTWRMTVPSRDADAVLPALSTPFKVATRDTDTWDFTFTEGKASGEGSVDDVMTQATLAALQGVHGTVIVDPRGVALKLSIWPSDQDLQYAQDPKRITTGSYYAMEMARTAFMHLCTPFPTEPIGVGGSWRVERPTSRGSLTYTELATFTVERFTPTGVQLSVRFGGRPDLYGPLKVEQLDLQVSGSGIAFIEFAQPLPVRFDEHVTLHALVGPKEGQRVEHQGALDGRLQYQEKAKP